MLKNFTKKQYIKIYIIQSSKKTSGVDFMNRKTSVFTMLFLLMAGAIPICVASETNAPGVTLSEEDQYVESLTSSPINILV